MKKLFLATGICLFFLSSCNFPLQSTQADPVNLVSTRVAQTLTAAPVTITIESPQPIPTNSLPTLESSPSATPTELITPTITPTPADPKLTLGSPAYTNTFSSGSDFDLPYSDEAVKLTVHDSGLDFLSLGVDYGLRYQLTYPKPQNFYLEGVFQTISCSGLDHYGLVARSPNYSDGFGYYIGFSCDGRYKVEKWDTFGLSTIQDWTADPHIFIGQGQTNRLGVLLKGTEIKIYANGILIKELTDSTHTNGGHYGIFGGAKNSTDFNFVVTEISHWNLP